MKKILSLSLALVMIASLSINSMAAGPLDSGISKDKKNDVVNIIKSTPYEQRNEALVTLLDTSGGLANPKVSFNAAEMSSIDMNDVTVVEATVDEVIEIDEDTSIVFLSSGTFLVYDAVDVPAVTRTYTSTKKSLVSAYNGMGYIIWEAWAEGYFSYNGSTTPTPTLTDANYAKYGVLNAWNVENWSSGTSKNDSNKTAVFRASGTFYWGITWEGNGWKIETYTITVGYRCNSSGTLTNLKTGL